MVDLTCKGARIGQAAKRLVKRYFRVGLRPGLGGSWCDCHVPRFPCHTSTALLGVSQAGSLQRRVTAPVIVSHGAHKGGHHCDARIPRLPSMYLAARRRTHALCLCRTDRCRRRFRRGRSSVLLVSHCTLLTSHCSHLTAHPCADEPLHGELVRRNL